MLACPISTIFATVAPVTHTGTPKGVPASADCAIRKAAYAYGQHLQPRKRGFASLHAALQLHGCGVPAPSTDDSWRPSDDPISTGQPILHVLSNTTTANITGNSTFSTIAAAVAASRAFAKPLTIVLGRGTHFVVGGAIQLGSEDSGLTIRNEPGQRAVVSGGKALTPSWVPSSACIGCFTASLIGQVPEVHGLRRNGVREIRARFPDFDPERDTVVNGTLRCLNGTNGYISESPLIIPNGAIGINGYNGSWPPTDPAITHVIDAHDWPGVDWPMAIMTNGSADSDRFTGEGDWGQHWVGVGGTCADREPPAGYWCAPGAPRHIATPNHASGIRVNSTLLPHWPYSRAEGAVYHVWGFHHWYTNMYEVGSRAGNNLTFSRGGTQGAEGSADWGAQWYIENVLEELDSPREWYFDNKSKQLYYKPNVTAPTSTHSTTSTRSSTSHVSAAASGAPSGEFVATLETVLFNISGSMETPVTNITLFGLELRDTAPSYFASHGLPSGGDWALAPQGAVTVSGTERFQLRSCLLTRLDGNAVFIGGYNRNATISDNEFEWLGESAIAAWGQTSTAINQNFSKGKLPAAIGPDGRSGMQPIGTKVLRNIISEIGIWQKQSSAWFQAISAMTTFAGNIVFNGPRAAINFNDGFGGGDRVTNNLLLNMVRESGDHGPINAWDRVPYISTIRNGSASILPARRSIDHNFIIANYNSEGGVDTDDGASYFDTTDNFIAYGANGLKSDFGGHDHRYERNVLAYVTECLGAPMPFRYFKGYNDAFVNNTCVVIGAGLGAGPYSSDCYLDKSWEVGRNRVLTKTATAQICGKSWDAWFATNTSRDIGSTLGAWPSDEELISLAAKLLNFTDPAKSGD